MAIVKPTHEFNMNAELFSLNDIEMIVKHVLEEQLSLGDKVREVIVAEILDEFVYINWRRFEDANCPGCVTDIDSCSVLDKIADAMNLHSDGMGDPRSTKAFKAVQEGKITRCPRRHNGTFIASPGEGIKSFSLQTDYTPIPLEKFVKPEEKKKE